MTYEFAAEGMQSRQPIPGHCSLEASSLWMERGPEGLSAGVLGLLFSTPHPGESAKKESDGSEGQ